MGYKTLLFSQPCQLSVKNFQLVYNPENSNEDIKSLISIFKKVNQRRNPDQYLIPNDFQIQKELVHFTIRVMQGQFLLDK